jgi:hypothetical protein
MITSRNLIFTLFVLGVLYVLVVQQFFKHETRFLFQTEKYTEKLESIKDGNFHELELPINQDVNLYGQWYKQEKTKGLVLLFPDADFNFRSNIQDSYYFLNGFDILIPAYRSTFKSRGKPETEEDLYSDGLHWYNFVRSQFPEEQIIIVGQGFGASIAGFVAGNKPAALLLLESPYLAFGEYIAKKKFWWLPYNYFTRFPLKTWENIRKVRFKMAIIIENSSNDGSEIWFNYLKSNDIIKNATNKKGIPFSQNRENDLVFDFVFKSINPETASD